MKKMLSLACMVLFLTLMVLLSCATVKPVTQADLPGLIGKWKGFYQDRSGYYTQPVELRISDENLKGSWTWNHADRPATTTPPFNGRIENGRIMYSWPGGKVNLSLRKGEGKMKLEGDYQIEQYQGTISLDKVKE